MELNINRKRIMLCAPHDLFGREWNRTKKRRVGTSSKPPQNKIVDVDK